MLGFRRLAGQSAGKLRVSRARYSTGTHGKDGHEVKHFAGSSTEHGHHHAGPKNESLGTQFYFVLALVPACAALYAYAQPRKDGQASGIAKVIESYSYYKEKWAARNTLHTAMIEQAAFDSNLFKNSQGSSHINLRFPEIFNTGSPHNVVAGQGGANLDKLVAHYEKINADEVEAKAKKLEEKK